MRSVFLIKSPLQLLNAVEAKHYFKLRTENCVLIVMGDRKSQPQILKLASSMGEWGNLIVLNESPLFIGNPLEHKKTTSFKVCGADFFKKSFFYVRRLNRIQQCLGEVEYIFVGYPRYVYMKHFINITPHKEVFLLDDGNATIQLAKERRDSVSAEIGMGWKKKLKKSAKRVLQGVKDTEKEALSFFTIYDIVASKNDSVIKNDFDYIRSRLDLLEVTEAVYFLGSPLSEVGILSQDDYLGYLRRVKEYYNDKKIVYIIHRRESKDKLKLIERELGLGMVLYEYPIEYQLAMVGPRPSVLSSFFSSALDTCALIFKNDLKITSFKIDVKNNLRKEEIESIYSSYDSNENSNILIEADY